MSVASSKILALDSLIPYLGKIIFRASDWTAASAKKPQHGSKQLRGSKTFRGYMLLVKLNLSFNVHLYYFHIQF